MLVRTHAPQPEWPLFKCGHPRSEDNTYRKGDYSRCVQCAREAAEDSRRRRLPEVIKATERKLEKLYDEARSYSMDELLSHRWAFDMAWNDEIRLAKEKARKAGLPDSLGPG